MFCCVNVDYCKGLTFITADVEISRICSKKKKSVLFTCTLKKLHISWATFKMWHSSCVNFLSCVFFPSGLSTKLEITQYSRTR